MKDLRGAVTVQDGDSNESVLYTELEQYDHSPDGTEKYLRGTFKADGALNDLSDAELALVGRHITVRIIL